MRKAFIAMFFSSRVGMNSCPRRVNSTAAATSRTTGDEHPRQAPALEYEDEETGDGDENDEEVEPEDEDDREPIPQEPPPTWYEVLNVAPNASLDEIRQAYRGRLMQYHPDRVAHLGEKLRRVADEEATAINQAYEQAMVSRR